MRPGCRFGLGDGAGERVDHPRKSQMAQSRGELWIHDRKSSKVYWVIGRMAESAVRTVGCGGAGGRITSCRIV
jgi:hypothetical protein